MSIHAAKWAWAQRVGHPTRKLVLVALADHANADGECWPSMRLVAEFAECSGRTVQRHIDALEDEGFIKRVSRRTRGDGRFSSWNYRLPITGDAYVSDGHECPADNLSGGHERPCPADTGDHVQRTRVSGHEPSGEPSTEPSLPRKRARQVPEGWQPPDDVVTDLRSKHPRVDLDRELEKFRNHHQAKGSTFKEPAKAFRNWIANAEDWGYTKPNAFDDRSNSDLDRNNPDLWMDAG